MNNIFIKIKHVYVFILLIVTLLSLSSCKSVEEAKYDNEKDVLNIGYITDKLEVNPFLISSSVEKEICSYMFSSFLTLDVNGNIKYGEDYNTVVKDMKKYYENENHNISNEYKDGYKPVYEFVIKKGMKFSDDVEITYDDILFNLYTYLDPAYDGLNTLYTLPIKGLYEYSNQISKDDLEYYKTICEQIKADYIAQNGKYFGSKRIYSFDEWTKYEEVLINNMIKYIKMVVSNNYNIDDDQIKKDKIIDEEKIICDYLLSKNYDYNYSYADGDNSGYVYLKGIKYPLVQNKNGNYVFTKDNNKNIVVYLDNLTTEEKEKYNSLTHYILGTRSDDLFYLMNGKGLKYENYEDLYYILLNIYTTDSSTVDYDRLINNELGKYTNNNKFFDKVLKEFIEEENKLNTSIDKSINSISGINVINIDGVDTLRIELDREDTTILEKLTFFVSPKHYYTAGYKNQFRLTNYGVPLNKPDFLAHLKTFNFAPVGSGPYKMIFDGTYKNDGYICLERNKYFETMKGLDAKGNNIKNANIKFLNIYAITQGEEYEALESGKVSYIKTNLSIDLASRLTMKYGIALTESLSYSSIVIDSNVIPNQYERKALQSVMDTSKIFSFFPENMAKTIEYNSSTLYDIYPQNKVMINKYDESLKSAIDNFILAGYKFDYDSYTFELSPSYVFYLDTKEKNSPFGEILINAQSLLESLGISTRIDSGIKRENVKYSVYTQNNYLQVDPDLTYKFTTDRITESNINKLINNLYSLGYDNDLGCGMYNVYSLDTKLNQSLAIDNINRLINELNSLVDKEKRLLVYEEILKCYNELALEVPAFQAYDLYVYDYGVIDERSLSGIINFTFSPMAEIWKVRYVD